MYLSEHFGRAFWVDPQNEFRSCPLFVNNKPDYSQADYVSEWTDWEGVNYEILFNIHRKELINKIEFEGKYDYNDFELSEDVYNEVKKCYTNDNLEDNISYIDSLLTPGI